MSVSQIPAMNGQETFPPSNMYHYFLARQSISASLLDVTTMIVAMVIVESMGKHMPEHRLGRHDVQITPQAACSSDPCALHATLTGQPIRSQQCRKPSYVLRALMSHHASQPDSDFGNGTQMRFGSDIACQRAPWQWAVGLRVRSVPA